MTTPITNEFRMKVFCLYLPCKALYIPTGKIVDIAGYSHDTGYIEFCDMIEDNDSDGSHNKNFQLILKPLSSISDVDGIAIAEILGEDPEEFKSEFEDYNGIIEGLFNEIPGYFINAYSVDLYINVGDYLRSKNYCLPYMGVDLIESGIAIYEQK